MPRNRITQNTRKKLIEEFRGIRGSRSALNPPTAISNRVTGTAAEIEGLFGTRHQFLQKYENFQKIYVSALQDPKNLVYNPDPARLQTALRRRIYRF